MTETAIALRWGCGCITYVDSAPEHLTKKDKAYIGEQVAEGAEVLRATPDELRAMPHFLPANCPHKPQGWSRGVS